jgi:hypothetical protein
LEWKTVDLLNCSRYSIKSSEEALTDLIAALHVKLDIKVLEIMVEKYGNPTTKQLIKLAKLFDNNAQTKVKH